MRWHHETPYWAIYVENDAGSGLYEDSMRSPKAINGTQEDHAAHSPFGTDIVSMASSRTRRMKTANKRQIQARPVWMRGPDLMPEWTQRDILRGS